jgi:hypothetical protein
MLHPTARVRTANPPLTRPEKRHCSFSWQTAYFDPLQPYESVTRQYESLGVRFAHAIALRPSNPEFVSPSEVVIMPIAGQKDIVLHLRRLVVQVQLQVIGSQPVTLSTLDGSGHCVAQGQLQTPPTSKPTGATWQQCLVIKTHSVRTVHIGSKSPFVIHSLQVLHQGDARRDGAAPP